MIPEKKLAGIVGADHISSRKKVLEEFGKDMSFVNAIMPGLVIRPGTAAQVEDIVNLAGDTGTPLVPVSSGPPHFRGDSVPSVGGTVIVDLSGMQKIIRVDRLNRVAMCEPGVTFGPLIEAVKKDGLRLNMPLLPRKSKSVVGSLLEREPVVMPKYHWDIADPLNCVEIILGSGAKFRTGAAAGPGTLEEQWEAGGGQVEAAGPSTSSWYRIIQGSQGTMGIVTWASVRCEIVPRLEAPYLIGSADLNKIMEIARWLVRLRLVNECFVLNGTNLAAIMAKKWPADYREIRETLTPWVLFYNVAGYDYFPEDRVKGQEKDILEICQKAVLEPAQALGKVSAFELLKAAQQPSGEPFWKLRCKGACQDVFFLTDYETLTELINIMYSLCAEAGYPATDMGVYVQPIVQGSNYHCEFNLFYEPDNRREKERVKALSATATKKLMAGGAFFSRPYGENTAIIMNKDAATVAALKKVKAILDPGNVMNPGKLCF